MKALYFHISFNQSKVTKIKGCGQVLRARHQAYAEIHVQCYMHQQFGPFETAE
jgi:hypothetical protein